MSRWVELEGARHLLVRLPLTELRARGLSRAEERVVELALDGQSNRVIADLRRTSPRTVANQLSSAYGKLGVRSRAELARRLVESAGPNELASGEWQLVQRVESGSQCWAIVRRATHRLTGEERRALELRADGATFGRIARELGVSEPTASRRVRKGMQKLGLTRASDLARVFGPANTDA